MRTLNLGILAHVDSGKTSLTERLLFAAGVIDEIGSVDGGNTQTDTLALERQRGITIKSAVASFVLGDVAVNLIDTPGHPDFIAEVERVLSVLDGAVLVVSAVEGVQPQTRILMRALKRLRIPTLLFVNKIDRAGAGDERVLRAISERLSIDVVALGTPHELGTKTASFRPSGAGDPRFRVELTEVLAERNDGILASYVEDDSALPFGRLREELARQTREALVHPVFFGSALTGAGVEALTAGIAELLPSAAGDPDGPLSGTVFKIERGPSGERIAYVRVFSGTIRIRDRVRFGTGLEEKVTAIAVFEDGHSVARPSVSAGWVAKLWGLSEVQVGDRIGETGLAASDRQFAPPTLESVVVPRDPDDGARLRAALAQLAEQDPLIDVRQSDAAQLSVSLYGEVQKEVIDATLAGVYGLDVEFRELTPLCIERPVGCGEAVEILQDEENPFSATIGLRIDPASSGSGVELRLAVDPRALPLYLYKTLGSFTAHMEGYVRQTLAEGLFGWEVTDCTVTVSDCGYYVGDGPGKPSGATPRTTSADFRKLTPLVLMHALERAGTVVCEPMLRARIELPTETIAAVLALLARLGAVAEPPSALGELATIEAVLPAGHVQDLQRQLPAVTAGEGVLESDFAGYRPVVGAPPVRRRTTPNPLNREEYLLHLARRR